MTKSILFCLFVCLQAFSTLCVAAPIETFKFDSPEAEKIFHKLSEELRCLVCQNQNIAESNSELAKDLRSEIHTMLIDGQSEEQIVEFMVQRYGDYVLYRPPFKPMTWLLWFGPFLVFLLGLFFVIRLLKSQSSAVQAEGLSETERQRIQDLQPGQQSGLPPGQSSERHSEKQDK